MDIGGLTPVLIHPLPPPQKALEAWQQERDKVEDDDEVEWERQQINTAMASMHVSWGKVEAALFQNLPPYRSCQRRPGTRAAV